MSSGVEWPGTVHATDRAGIRELRIDHGERNLLNPGVMGALRSALLAADEDPAVSGILLAGDGSLFCGGLDVGAIQAGADPEAFARALVELLRVFPRLGTPIVAAVNGDALASGAALVAVCDLAVMADDARIGTMEVSVGIWPMIAQVPLIQRLGPRVAMENVGSGEPFTATRAREVGLINAVVPAGEVIPRATAWLHQASRAGAVGVIGRRTLYELAELSYDDALDVALERFVAMLRPAD